MASGDCTAAGFASAGSALVPAGTPLTTGSAPTTFHLTAGTATGAGAARSVCFAVSLPPGAPSSVSGKTVTPVWHFDAVSD